MQIVECRMLIFMNILGIDYGEKRIGLAWCQEGLDLVLPFGVIQKEKGDIGKEALKTLIEKERIDTIIFGLPIGLDGTENENTKKIRAFADELKKETSVPIAFVDERFTSQQADRMGGDASRDEKAAMVILQSYLDHAAC